MKNLNDKAIEKMLSSCIDYIERNIRKIEESDGKYTLEHKRNDGNLSFKKGEDIITYSNMTSDLNFGVVGRYKVRYDDILNKLDKIFDKPKEKVEVIVETPPIVEPPKINERVFQVQNKKNQIFEMTDSEIYKEVIFSDNFNREFKKLRVGEEMYEYDHQLYFKRIK